MLTDAVKTREKITKIWIWYTEFSEENNSMREVGWESPLRSGRINQGRKGVSCDNQEVIFLNIFCP
jgi:hypothetical protein